METLYVYGFGSFFKGKFNPNDVDILLLHRSTDRESCQFAISCKTHLKRLLPEADIVMLSAVEARGNNFLAKSEAVALEMLKEGEADDQVEALVKRLRSDFSMDEGNPLSFSAD